MVSVLLPPTVVTMNVSSSSANVALSKYTTSDEDLASLTADPSWLVRLNVAANPNSSLKTLQLLFKDPDEMVRAAVVKRDLSPEVLTTFAHDPSWMVRCAVADNLKTLVVTVIYLSDDEEELVRSCVAANPNTPIDVLRKLTVDSSWLVRVSVTENVNLPINILKTFSSDTDIRVRDSVDISRVERLQNFVNTLPSTTRVHAQLLAPSFTGWPDDLARVLTSLRTSSNGVAYGN